MQICANARYNPHGRERADRFQFPYPDASFDIGLAASVFTHMLGGEVVNYIREAQRVLRPGGRLLSSWFVLQMDRTRQEGAEGRESAWFPSHVPGVGWCPSGCRNARSRMKRAT
jgi:ubiquinone/menaquinone biosynthesis C-methylase UbiE